MERPGAMFSSVAGGWFAFCVALMVSGAEPVWSQQAGPSTGLSAGAPSTAPSPSIGATGVEPSPSAPQTLNNSGPVAAPDSGSSFIETLNHALEQALTGHSAGQDEATGPAGSVALAARDGQRPKRGPVVVELFTAQGCASCPPADELFLRYADREDVIALAQHVDYWDYLGWEDPFAQPAFTARQKAYARAARSRSIYTPQMMVEGAQSLIGADGKALDALIAQEQARPPEVSLNVTGSDGRYVIDLTSPKPLDRQALVQIVRYAPAARVAILRGENAGMVIDYANVVTAWHAVAEWDGHTPTRLSARIEGDQPAVVIVQTVVQGKVGPLPGPILAAQRMN